MIKKSNNAPILDEPSSQNFFNQIMELWINPEIEKRRKSGTINENFTFDRCLIRMPKNKPMIVEFNDEVGWIAIVRKDHESSFKKNDPVHIFQINEILDVKPPLVDEKRVAFVFLHIVKGEWCIFFDFSPNHEDWKESNRWDLGKSIATSLQESLEEKTILVTTAANNLLNKIGLWSAPALISYPLSKIIKQLSENDTEGAIKTLREFCTPSLLEKLSTDWFDIEIFRKRKQIIQDALKGHRQGLYTLTIPSLLPHIEGLITDWIITKLPKEQIPWKQNSKTKKFHELVIGKTTPKTYSIIVNSAINFILKGPVLSTFKNWVDDINSEFPNRHVVEHGKYDESLFTELNSIKLFLLIDTIHHIVAENK